MARGEIGKHPYIFGAKTFTPDGSLDCSGFSAWCYRQIGIDIGPGTWFQREFCRAHGKRVIAPYQAGDLLFFMDKGLEVPSHVGIASGEDSVIEETASFSANVLEAPVSPRWAQPFVEGWRIL